MYDSWTPSGMVISGTQWTQSEASGGLFACLEYIWGFTNMGK